MQKNAGCLKSKAQDVSAKVGGNLLNLASLLFYTTIVYAMKLLELSIAVRAGPPSRS